MSCRAKDYVEILILKYNCSYVFNLFRGESIKLIKELFCIL